MIIVEREKKSNKTIINSFRSFCYVVSNTKLAIFPMRVSGLLHIKKTSYKIYIYPIVIKPSMSVCAYNISSIISLFLS